MESSNGTGVSFSACQRRGERQKINMGMDGLIKMKQYLTGKDLYFLIFIGHKSEIVFYMEIEWKNYKK